MKKIAGTILLAFVLVGLSALLFMLHYGIDHDKKFIIDWFLGSLAFMPISVLFVTIIFDRVIAGREKAVLLGKLNMVIGAFFAETGTELLKNLAQNADITDDIRSKLMISGKWERNDFENAKKALKGHSYGLEAGKADLVKLKDLLTSKRSFLLRLLENQNLLEHETFTDLLWAVFHLCEELETRKDLKKLGKPDLLHISGDMQRVFGILVTEWLGYMSHLKNQYPYLYSLAVRTNPFNDNADAEVKE